MNRSSERGEVVLDQACGDAGSGGDAAVGDRGVALVHHELLGTVEDRRSSG